MILTLHAQRPAPDVPAGDLGFLLHKHPDRVLTAEHGAVTTHVLYPQSTPEDCEVAVLLDVDPVGLVRTARDAGQNTGVLGQYVNDRPYAASSLLAVALGRVFSTALAGRCAARPDLVDLAWPLRLRLPAVPCSGGQDLLRRLFEPLGWSVRATVLPLDETVPGWGASRYVDVELEGRSRVADALAHLYVLLPVLDDAKHYWVGEAEVDKLLRRGGDWLARHPERDLVTRRYLAHSRPLVVDALDRLADLDEQPAAVPEQERPVRLVEHRRATVLAVLRDLGAGRVIDLGCGQGELVRELAADPRFTAVVGTDVSVRALRTAARRLRLDQRGPDEQDERVRLFQSALTYRDERLAGFDAAVLSEVVEHVDPPRLAALERVVFAAAAPTHVLVTTPNAEYNVNYPGLRENGFRHPDHRFEWTRAQFARWAGGVADRHGYAVRFQGVGEADEDAGAPTQLAVFSKEVSA
ncbi:3' terminal RNA ribose 2'-O-methyltransferase Hen1 [Kineococcus rhizosphaerae]|uniref:Small RNA 2'-O-methyltransferase n=1 Tax=Kineococcus rhizosphaerae TaxID=559628 RepID=A0A2T0R456_9ACTN|nr:3' terminal RNA ribose 2'-O-methyltransferase Hen1 [Kineococcus rhizosphaerae]PRY15110.1 3' terminal RNA ribose 2'-O-methyltransferase Hen1 [Kineococcus rhizosphaerae]